MTREGYLLCVTINLTKSNVQNEDTTVKRVGSNLLHQLYTFKLGYLNDKRSNA